MELQNNASLDSVDAFQIAKDRIDEIEMPDYLKPVFLQMMDNFSVFFRDNPQIKLDVNKIFEEHLYNDLKIGTESIEKIWEKQGKGASGYYSTRENILVLEDNFEEMSDSDKGHYVHIFTHEFVHFIIHNSGHDKLPVWADEMMTEIMSREISGGRSISYQAIIDFGELFSGNIEPFLGNGVGAGLFFNGEFIDYLNRNNLNSDYRLVNALNSIAQPGRYPVDDPELFVQQLLLKGYMDKQDYQGGMTKQEFGELFEKTNEIVYLPSPFSLIHNMFNAMKSHYLDCELDMFYMDENFIKKSFDIDYEKIRNADAEDIFDILNTNGNLKRLQRILSVYKEAYEDMINAKHVSSESEDLSRQIEKLQCYFDCMDNCGMALFTPIKGKRMKEGAKFTKESIIQLLDENNIQIGEKIAIKRANLDTHEFEYVLAEITRTGDNEFDIIVDPGAKCYGYLVEKGTNDKIIEIEKNHMEYTDNYIEIFRDDRELKAPVSSNFSSYNRERSH